MSTMPRCAWMISRRWFRSTFLRFVGGVREVRPQLVQGDLDLLRAHWPPHEVLRFSQVIAFHILPGPVRVNEDFKLLQIWETRLYTLIRYYKITAYISIKRSCLLHRSPRACCSSGAGCCYGLHSPGVRLAPKRVASCPVRKRPASNSPSCSESRSTASFCQLRALETTEKDEKA